MIRLTIHAQSEPKIHLFNKALISIGCESSGADLCISEECLQPVFLHIVEQNGFPIINNLANDPYISLNGHPFGKKLLNHGDVILIRDTEILFENIVTAPPVPNTKPKPTNTTSISTAFDFHLPFENDVEILKDEEWQSSKIDQLLAELESHAPQLRAAPPKAISSNLNLKDDYLRDLDDETQQKNRKLEKDFVKPSKWLKIFAFSFFTIMAMSGTVTYLQVSDKTSIQEITAARSVADIAMGLTHARLDHVKPSNQNWSNIDFLKSNLKAILPNSVSYASDIDPQGQFRCCPYSLRTYTSRDLSRFLLIAQPAPSFLQWLIPKSIILVDSESMEIRAINDLKDLNRLLASPNPLENGNGVEIAKLLKASRLITLSQLSEKIEETDFTPPKQLAKMIPGSEHYIYNAPRYYRLGQSVIKKLNHLSTSIGTSHEVATLKLDIEALTRLPNIILYSPDGKAAAWKTKQSLATFSPSNDISVAYLNFTSQGDICECEIIAATENEPNEDITTNRKTLLNEKDSPTEITLEESNDEASIDINHPIYVQLSALSLTREKGLNIEAHKIKDLLTRETHSPQPHFVAQFHDLTMNYIALDSQYNMSINKLLKMLYGQYEELPISEFLQMVKVAGFQSILEEDDSAFNQTENVENNESAVEHGVDSSNEKANDDSPAIAVGANVKSEEVMRELFIEVENAKTFSELQNLISIGMNTLNFDHFSHSDMLMKYQNQFRNRVILRFEQLLFSADQHAPLDELDSLKEKDFQAILSHEKIFHPSERDFYQKEWRRILN